MSIWSVYIITNKLNAKQYVGISKNIKQRWNAHLSANGSAPALHAAIKKYGKDNFVFSQICDAFDFEAACDIERLLIKQHNTKHPNGYNLTDGGEGVVGHPMTDEGKEIRRNASLAFLSNLSDEERAAKYGTKGRKYSLEQIEKIRASNKGKNLGKKASQEVRAKLSAIHKARPRKPLSEETKEKIRQSLLGRKMPEAEKPKHASFLGRKHTEETKAKIRASNIATKALMKAKKLAEEGVENA
jgi:group I intron endonuclease